MQRVLRSPFSALPGKVDRVLAIPITLMEHQKASMTCKDILFFPQDHFRCINIDRVIKILSVKSSFQVCGNGNN